jgi:hypothetical protein
VADKKKIIVVVPHRDGTIQGFWSLGISRGQGVHFPKGKTEIDVTPAELEELKVDEAKGFITLVELAAGERLVQPEPVQPEKPAKK